MGVRARTHWGAAVWTAAPFLILGVVLCACGSGAAGAGAAASAQQPILSQQDIATVRQSFVAFQPELFAPGTNPSDSTSLLPSNFTPAQFFGPPVANGTEKTPQGIQVQTNGYDGLQMPLQFPSTGTYFDRQENPHVFQMGIQTPSPLNVIQQRMNLTVTANAPVFNIDLSEGRLNLAEVDDEMLFVQDQLATVLPAVAAVDPKTAMIIIEPSIFYVTASNLGSTWAGGLTEDLDDGSYQIHLSAFYMVVQPDGTIEITNWKSFLIDEAINFYVLSIGRKDLAM